MTINRERPSGIAGNRNEAESIAVGIQGNWSGVIFWERDYELTVCLLPR